MKRKQIAILSGIFAMALFATACTTTPAQRGAMGGAAVGGVAGQIIGGDTESTLLGAGAGALGGAILNDHIDSQKRDAYNQGYNQGSATSQPQQQQPSYNTAPR